MTARIAPTRPLSRAEQAVADLVAEGLTNRQIGERLWLSHRTVQTHVQHILRKWDCHSRVQVAVRVQVARAVA